MIEDKDVVERLRELLGGEPELLQLFLKLTRLADVLNSNFRFGSLEAPIEQEIERIGGAGRLPILGLMPDVALIKELRFVGDKNGLRLSSSMTQGCALKANVVQTLTTAVYTALSFTDIAGAGSGTLIFHDQFTEVGNVPLASHTPTPTGTAWAEVEDTSGVRNLEAAASDICRADGNASPSQRILYTCTPTPTVPDVDVELTLTAIPGSTDTPIILLARYQDINNYYAAVCYAGGAATDKKIVKKVAGVFTLIASGDFGTTVADVLKFELRGSTLKLFQNGVERLSVVDTAITTAGAAGQGLGATDVSTDGVVAGWEWDEYKVTEVPTGAPVSSENFDTDDMHDPLVNPTRITIRTEGIYIVGGNVAFVDSGIGRRELEILKNGTLVMARQTGPAAMYRVTLSKLLKLVKDDYLQLRAMQSSGANLDTVLTDDGPGFWAHRLS